MFIDAQLTGNNTIAFNGQTVTHRTPILHAARVVAEPSPDAVLRVYRDGRIVIQEAISKLAKLTVTENEKTGPKFAKFVPFDPLAFV